LAGLEVAIRWPNDLTVAARKLAGVLTERRGREGADACVCGVGLNVNVAREQFPPALRDVATSMLVEAGHPFEREQVAAVMLRRLAARYQDCTDERWDAVAAAWRQRCRLEGQVVALELAGESVRGTVVAVDPVAGIELQLADGSRRAFAAERTAVVRVGAAAANAME
jgi:BirA family biotin operon repressor/biotin-[acetyl-CoA-carboxylase] ligase